MTLLRVSFERYPRVLLVKKGVFNDFIKEVISSSCKFLFCNFAIYVFLFSGNTVRKYKMRTAFMVYADNEKSGTQCCITRNGLQESRNFT